MTLVAQKTLAVWKFASCGGCQLSVLEAVEHLGDLASSLSIAHFPEISRNVSDGPYDISLVEGSLATPHDLHKIQEVREKSEILVTMGTCAAAGGVQALGNGRRIEDFAAERYDRPAEYQHLDECLPIHQHVRVDHRLFGCPVTPEAVAALLRALLEGRQPETRLANVCTECRKKGFECVMTRQRTPCLGSATRAGCGALCPAYGRGCFGCFGPRDHANLSGLAHAWRRVGASDGQVVDTFRTFHAGDARLHGN